MPHYSRREFLRNTSTLAALAGLTASAGGRVRAAEERPNVVVVITDDQGFGDLGAHGNEHIRTPNLDRLHAESTRLTRFHVCPVCSPTRACLMTGRYNYRTGAIDTYLGRSMMYCDEVTMAEVFRTAGYRTGIFGKWHLGDNYPMRAMDQGFDEALVHQGGGIGQPSDPPGNSYFDPILEHNGRQEQHAGYCTDIFTTAAIDFIKEHRDDPFFVYLSTNAPHSPHEVAEEYYQPYLDMGLDETVARIYGMVENIDDNVGRLTDALDGFGLAENTILVFLTDNGPGGGAGNRYNAGLRGSKGQPYEGGIRVPCFVRWPARLAPNRDIDRIAGHIDLLPTLAAACGGELPADRKIDGRNLMPLLSGEAGEWPDRHLFFQWHRGDEPEPFRGSAVLTQRFKLVNGEELYDLENDPGEKENLAEQHPDKVADLRTVYEAWFADVSASRGYDPPRIYIGAPEENPAVLTRQDWRGPEGWGDKDAGHWLVKVVRHGVYDVRVDAPAQKDAEVCMNFGGEERRAAADGGTALFQGIVLTPGDMRVDAWLEGGGKRFGASFVTVTRVGDGT